MTTEMQSCSKDSGGNRVAKHITGEETFYLEIVIFC